MAGLTGDKVISGTFGQVWLDGELVAEAFGLQAQIEFEKEDVPLPGKYATDTKFMGYKGTGSLRMRKVNSRMINKLKDAVIAGINPQMQIISGLADPSAAGSERIEIKDARFDNLTLVNWELRQLGEVECPFTFTEWQVHDSIN